MSRKLNDCSQKNCDDALKELGKLSHSIQDYYGHGVSVKYGRLKPGRNRRGYSDRYGVEKMEGSPSDLGFGRDPGEYVAVNMSLRMAAGYESGRSSAGLASPCWSCSYEDALGRTICETRPGFRGALLVTSNKYNTANQLVTTRTYSSNSNSELQLVPLAFALICYNSLGQRNLTVSDMSLNSQIDWSDTEAVGTDPGAGNLQAQKGRGGGFQPPRRARIPRITSRSRPR
jgi:hypothetical protein